MRRRDPESEGGLTALFEGFDHTFTWKGLPIWKNPVDLIVYQMIAHEVGPTVVIETGTHLGGSAAFWRDVTGGRVITIDIDQRCLWSDPAIVALEGTSTDPEILKLVSSYVGRHDRVLVNLDSTHRYAHVLDELWNFSPFVTPGSYVIVEDGIDDIRYQRNGPRRACLDWVAEHPEFAIDKSREVPGFTNCPDGFLRRQ